MLLQNWCGNILTWLDVLQEESKPSSPIELSFFTSYCASGKTLETKWSNIEFLHRICRIIKFPFAQTDWQTQHFLQNIFTSNAKSILIDLPAHPLWFFGFRMKIWGYCKVEKWKRHFTEEKHLALGKYSRTKISLNYPTAMRKLDQPLEQIFQEKLIVEILRYIKTVKKLFQKATA